MTDELRQQIEAEAQAHEAARDRNLDERSRVLTRSEQLLMEANQHQGAAVALRALLAAPAPPIEQKEPEING